MALHIKQRVLARDWFKCQYPGCRVTEDLTLDHILPRYLGGGDEPKNLITACMPHNSNRGHRALDEAVGPEAAAAMIRQATKELPDDGEAKARRIIMNRVWGK